MIPFCLFTWICNPWRVLISGTPLPDHYQDIVNNGGGPMAGHMAFKDNLVTQYTLLCHLITQIHHAIFKHWTSLKTDTPKTVWEEILRKNPQVGIVGMGDCRGSKALLEFATTQPEQLKALVLMAPFDFITRTHTPHSTQLFAFPYSDKLLLALMRYGYQALS